MTDTVLLVDDDPDVLRTVGAFLEHTGYVVIRAASGEEALEAADRERPDVVLLDLQLPDASGLDVLERLQSPDLAVLMVTGHGDVPTAVRAMQLGAENFLTKPVDMPHLMVVVSRAAEKVRLRREVRRLHGSEGATLDGALGVSPPMKALERQLALIAQSERTTVLLTGESGTGKGRVARQLHAASPRAAGPFVDVNCGGLTATFLDDELFGHERGAFTDAKQSKRGLFEVGDGGTLFLDEIGDLAPALQPKLLKVLETRRFRRLGGTRELSADVRLLVATHRDLQAAVEEGGFREDLYYRIGVTVVHLPPVRERTREDRLALIQRVLSELAGEVPGLPTALGGEALERLLAHAWPGNVREMRNALERAMIMARGRPEIGIEHLSADFRGGGRGGGVRRTGAVSLKDTERRQIERVLKLNSGNRTRAAKDLGISRVTLLKKLREYGLD
jgi:two-component system response regulator HydG